MDVKQELRHVLAVLEEERQAFAALDLERMMVCANAKQTTTQKLSAANDAGLDEEAMGLLDAARRCNAANRKMCNLIAAQISGRLDALTRGNVPYDRGKARTNALG